MVNKIIAAAGFVILITSTHLSADKNKSMLSKNPFVKSTPVKVGMNDKRIVPELSDTILDGELRATLSSGKNSIANIDGKMIFIGEKIKGYELIFVGEGFATFIKNGHETTLNVSEMHKKLK